MSAPDPLILLRSALAASTPPQLTTSSDPAESPIHITSSFVEATHLFFALPTPQCIPLSTKTRFVSTTPDEAEVDLRSIFFAWDQKDIPISEYISSTSDLNASLPADQQIRNLVFVEKIELITWLEGASDDAEHIRLPVGAPGTAEAVAKAEAITTGPGVPAVPGTGQAVVAGTQPAGAHVRVIDARLQQIYNGERKMGDHNTVLRGIKPTDFSYVRRHAETFLGKRKHGSQTATKPLPSRSIPSKPLINPSIGSAPTNTLTSKRQDPIILLSPSASSLLRLSNIKSFLQDGLWFPPEHPTLSNHNAPNLLHITRPLRSISDKPFRFIIVDSPDNFKPEYWSRVVAVFTTGQTWQFRSYKWREPQQLFENVLGVYVGEKGMPVPGDVRGWGSGVKVFAVDRWDERGHGVAVEEGVRRQRRWRDQEVVEEVWRSLEGWMRGKGEWRR